MFLGQTGKSSAKSRKPVVALLGEKREKKMTSFFYNKVLQTEISE